MSRAFSNSGASQRGRIIGCTSADIALAAAALKAGDLVGMPTETVYGLAADATNGEAVAAIYEAKGRPSFNPLIAHVADLAEAERHGLFNADALKLAEAFWPGPLTLVVPLRPGSPISDLSLAGLTSVALRVPAHPVALTLLRAVGRPIAAPSANLSGRVSPTTAKDVSADLGERVKLVLDAGPCAVGLESTIIGCLAERPVQLRPGGIPRHEIESKLALKMTTEESATTIQSPGQLASHYAPFAPVRMNATEFREGDAILAFGDMILPNFVRPERVLNLSPTSNLRQAAAVLFSALRELDAQCPAAIAVVPIPDIGLGEAINDRLRRASAPRSH
jgi:L-threonylcarbamoyladenylate synthase